MKWDNEQTARKVSYGFETKGYGVEERFLEVPLDPEKEGSPTSYLYYFTKDLAYKATKFLAVDARDRTILFISGGPGQVNRPSSHNFGDVPGFRLVYFHLRGTGFSQLPRSNYYDRFLRTRYAVYDIEAIRKDLLGEKHPWCAVIGHSYGTVLAQQYAHRYGTVAVKRLVLSAPLSHHRPTNETIQFTSLENIYKFSAFDFLQDIQGDAERDAMSETLANEAREISERAEEEFGSVHFLSTIYDREYDQNASFRSLLTRRGLDYGSPFYKGLRRLRQVGWLPHEEKLAKGATQNVDTEQQLAGLVIAEAILKRKDESYDLRQLRKKLETFAEKDKGKVSEMLRFAKAYFKASYVNTPRAYYVFSVYDGLKEEVLRELQAGSDLIDAISGLGGRNPERNDALKKIGLEHEAIDRWDPKDYRHSVPTLVFKGGADPVTEGGQAEHVFAEGLLGERMLLEFPGVGHSMSLPMMDQTGHGSKNTRDYILSEFWERGFEKKDSIVQALTSAFKAAETGITGRFEQMEIKASYKGTAM